ncbi:MAG: hypothetical protein AB8G22_11305 [Saprospiraceae bacterium]
MIDKEQKYYQRIKEKFIGEQVIEVYYEELDYQTDEEYWEMSTDIHSIDMNVILKMKSGQILQIKWDNEFFSYGIGFEELAAITKREGIKTIDVATNPNWQSIIGQKVLAIRVIWDNDESVTTTYHKNGVVENKTAIIKVPSSWEIEFQNSKIWISALEIEANYFWADHLTVFFTQKANEKYELIRKSSIKHSV